MFASVSLEQFSQLNVTAALLTKKVGLRGNYEVCLFLVFRHDRNLTPANLHRLPHRVLEDILR